MQLFSPTTADEAISLLSASPLTIDSPTQRRLRGDRHLQAMFTAGRRRPEWVWAARDDDRVVGVIGAVGNTAERPSKLDHFGLTPDRDAALALTAHASERAVALGVDEVGIFAPAGASFADPRLRVLADPLRAAGWRVLVERRHYEFAPSPGFAAALADTAPARLTFEQVTDANDPRLRAVHREVMKGTLDEHARAALARADFDEVCRRDLADLLEADPAECIHLAFDRRGECVGMVSGRTMPSGRAFVAFVGVDHRHRGHGYGKELLRWQTSRLLEDGATELVADTDNANTPMAAAFAEVGWPQTETRIDLVTATLPPPASP